MSKSDPDRSPKDEESANTEHLEDISSGCGCAKVWETLSEQRKNTE